MKLSINYFLEDLFTNFIFYSFANVFKVSYLEMFAFNFARISLFARSITEFSSDAKYICVVFSEVCPIPALMTDIGTL